MGYVSISRHLDASPEAAFALLVQPQRLPEWITLVTSVEETAGRLDRPGAACDVRLKIGGRRLDVRWHVTKVTPPRLLRIVATPGGGGEATVWWTLSPSGKGCDVQLETDYYLPEGPLAAVDDPVFVHRGVARELQHSLLNLEAIAQQEDSDLLLDLTLTDPVQPPRGRSAS